MCDVWCECGVSVCGVMWCDVCGVECGCVIESVGVGKFVNGG